MWNLFWRNIKGRNILSRSHVFPFQWINNDREIIRFIFFEKFLPLLVLTESNPTLGGRKALSIELTWGFPFLPCVIYFFLSLAIFKICRTAQSDLHLCAKVASWGLTSFPYMQIFITLDSFTTWAAAQPITVTLPLWCGYFDLPGCSAQVPLTTLGAGLSIKQISRSPFMSTLGWGRSKEARNLTTK